jgi:hypothetical protein
MGAGDFARMGSTGGSGTGAGPDVTAPTVTGFIPADNATGVANNADLRAIFSETVLLGSAGNITLKKTSDNSTIKVWNVVTDAGLTAGKVSVVSGNILTMRTSAVLADTTEFYVIWDAGVVTDPALNPVAALSVTTTWSFTTGVGVDVTAPTVITFSPLDNATGVAITTNLVATMSETVTLGASGVITLKRTSDNATIDSWNVATAGGSTAGKVEVVSGTALTMHLTTALANSIEYYVIWDAGVVVDLASNPVAVQSSTTLWSFTTVAGGTSYLLDVLGVSATRAYSTRKLRSAYAGSAIRIRRSSDNAEQDIGFVGEDLDTAAITTFVGANSAFVVTWYDQSGVGINPTQATVANQPRIVNAGTLDVKNTKPAPVLDGSNDFLSSVGGAVYTVKSEGAVVTNSLAGPTVPSSCAVLGGGTLFPLVATSGSSTYFNAVSTASVDNTGSASIIFGGVLQNVRESGVTGVTNASDTTQIGRDRGFGFWAGSIGEIVAFDTQLSAPNYATLYTNQKTYWGTP